MTTKQLLLKYLDETSLANAENREEDLAKLREIERKVDLLANAVFALCDQQQELIAQQQELVEQQQKLVGLFVGDSENQGTEGE